MGPENFGSGYLPVIRLPTSHKVTSHKVTNQSALALNCQNPTQAQIHNHIQFLVTFNLQQVNVRLKRIFKQSICSGLILQFWLKFSYVAGMSVVVVFIQSFQRNQKCIVSCIHFYCILLLVYIYRYVAFLYHAKKKQTSHIDRIHLDKEQYTRTITLSRQETFSCSQIMPVVFDSKCIVFRCYFCSKICVELINVVLSAILGILQFQLES